MKEMQIVFNAASTVLFIIATLNYPPMVMSSGRGVSRQSSAGYLDPYRFAYAIKTPLPFHGNFGQVQHSLEGASSNVNSKRERLPNQGSRSTGNQAKSVSTNTGKWSVDDDDLIALSASLDESTFGERIIPRVIAGRQETKRLKFEPSQQIIVTNPPASRKENRSKLNKKEISEFLSSASDSQSVSVDQPSPQYEKTTSRIEPTLRAFQDRIKNIKNEQDFSRSNNDYPSDSSFIDSHSKINEGFQIESTDFDSHFPLTDTQSRSNSADSGYSFSPFRSNSAVPDIFRNTFIPSVETELSGREVGSPGSVSSSIDALFAKFSPFPQQESFRLTDFSTQFTPTENTAERPFSLKVRDAETFRPPLSQEIVPYVQSVSAEPPAFVPSTPFKADDFLPSRYPELRPLSRKVISAPVVASTTGNIKPFQQPKFPEPNRYAGFIPRPLSGPGDSFTHFPKPNFPTFPSFPSKTLYFGGHPNEPPSHLQQNIVSFIKSKAVPDKALSVQNLRPNDSAFFPGNFVNSFPFKTIPNDGQGTRKQKSITSAVSKVKIQTVHSQPSNVINLGPLSPKKTFPSSRPKQNYLTTPNNVKPAVIFTTVATTARPSTSSPIPTTEIKISSTPLPIAKPTRFVASPLLSFSKPLPASSPTQVTRPVRVAQQSNQQTAAQTNTLPSAKSPVQQAQRGRFSGWTSSNSFTPSHLYSFVSSNPFASARNPTIPISPQIRQVLPNLTKNPAPVPVLAPLPVYLQPASVALPQRPSSKTFPLSIEKPVYYHAFVSYGEKLCEPTADDRIITMCFVRPRCV